MVVKIGLLVAITIVLYYPVSEALINAWLVNKAYSHGFLVPFISLYIIWTKRKKIQHIEVKPSNIGGALVLLLGGLMYISGNIGGIILLQELSLIVVITGLALLFLGVRYLRALSLPVAYLLFMIPFFDESSNRIHWPFQLFSANLGVTLLQWLGIPAYRLSQYIELPNITLEVAEQCSGIKYLISIVAIGIPLAYFTQKTFLRKVGLIGMAITVAILANALRVAFVGIWAYKFDEVNTHGPFHIFQGFLVSQIGFVVLFLGSWFFSKIPLKNGPKHGFCQTEFFQNKEGVVDVGSITKNTEFNRSWVTALIILLSIGFHTYFSENKLVPLKVDLEEFPLSIGEWKGGNSNSSIELEIPGIDQEIIRVYQAPSGHEIKLHAIYFEQQYQGKELINYITKKLHKRAEEIDISLGDQQSIRINKALMRDGLKDRLILFWYDIDGITMANRLKAKVRTTFNGLVKGQTNGAFIIIYSDLDHPDNKQKVLEKEVEFVRETYPLLHNYLP